MRLKPWSKRGPVPTHECVGTLSTTFAAVTNVPRCSINRYAKQQSKVRNAIVNIRRSFATKILTYLHCVVASAQVINPGWSVHHPCTTTSRKLWQQTHRGIASRQIASGGPKSRQFGNKLEDDTQSPAFCKQRALVRATRANIVQLQCQHSAFQWATYTLRWIDYIQPSSAR